ncbi:MAG: MaoC family dehydratase [Bacteroidota bacterium]|nr:MaoC family dehydratase [Bacteroidota bacterium]
MISPGQKFELEFNYSQKEVEAFAALTGDTNPLHINYEYAAATVFKKPIIHGFLGSAVFSRILGTEFPGEGTIYLSQSLSFKRPMYTDVTYKAIVTVTSTDTTKNTAVLKTIVVDPKSGKVIISGEASVVNKDKIV